MLMQVTWLIVLYCGMLRLSLAAIRASRSPGAGVDVTGDRSRSSSRRKAHAANARGRSEPIVPRVVGEEIRPRAARPISPPASLPHRRIAPVISDR
jgi:hypothetical protein